MKLIDYARLLLRRWLVLGVIAIVVTAAVYLVSSSRSPLYTATSAEYFGLAVGNSASDLSQGSRYVQDQMSSFGELATSPVVLNPVIDNLGLQDSPKQLARTITASTPRNTVILQITVTSQDPARAATIANAVGTQLGVAVDLVGPKLPNGKPLIAVRSIQTALPPTFRSSPNTSRDTALGLLIGLLLGAAVVIARARLDNTVRTPSDLAEVTTRRVLGTVRKADELGSRHVVVLHDQQSRATEDLRQLRAAIEQLALGRSNFALVVTSSIRGEGRSTVAANLAAALAEAGRRTVLVDADLRRPSLAEITGGNLNVGLLTTLEDTNLLEETLQEVEGSYSLLAAGGLWDNPAELLSSKEMRETIATLRSIFEFIIIDVPALLDAADGTALHDQVDGALLVVDASAVRRPQLETALQRAELGGLRILGIVLNKVAKADLASAQPVRVGRRPRHAPPPPPRENRSLPVLAETTTTNAPTPTSAGVQS